MDKVLSIPILLLGLYLLSALVIEKNRVNWSMTKIKTGALSNFGMGLFCSYGALLGIFAKLPFESFLTALLVGFLPMVFSSYLAYKGYKVDRKNHELHSAIKNT